MDPIAAELVVQLIRGGFMLAEAKLNRDVVVETANKKLAAGMTVEELAAQMQDGRIKSEIEAQQAIDQAGSGQSSS